MKVLAPAKVNLFLQVLGRRPDGYHDLVSLMVPVSLADELEVEPLSRPELVLEGGPPGLPAERNLVWRAARALAPHARKAPGARLLLTKRIPAAGGLGGGSSDAAAALVALRELWDCRLSDDEMNSLAAGLGADVPFFLQRSPAVIRGVGERVTSVTLPAGFPPHLAVIQPPFGLSTEEVYRKYDETMPSDEIEDPSLEAYLAREGTFPLRNDLEPAAFALRPELKALKQALIDSRAAMVLMSGSGSCFWAAWGSESARSEALGALTKSLKFYIVSPVRGVPGQKCSTASQED